MNWIAHQLLHVGGGCYRKLGNQKSRPFLATRRFLEEEFNVPYGPSQPVAYHVFVLPKFESMYLMKNQVS